MARPPKKLARAGVTAILDRMRDAFPMSESVHYLLAMVMLRWLADIRRNPDALPCGIELPPGLEYRVPLGIPDQELGTWFQQMFHQLETINPGPLGGVFRDLTFQSPRFQQASGQGILTRAVEILWFKDRYKCSYDLMDETLGIVRTTLAASGFAPSTPDGLCTLVARLLRPGAGDSIHDPACGTGMLLIRLAGFAEGCVSLSGAERHRTAWSVARINALFKSFPAAHIQRCDALQPGNVPVEDGQQRRFDVVVSHPPWSLREWRDETPDGDPFNRFRRGMPPRNNADYAYLLHMVSLMKEGTGRMAAVVSGGVLSRGGQEGRIRLRLVADNLVDIVIALPEKMFENTSVAGAILVMRHGKKSNDVLFVDARALGDGARNKNAFPAAALDRISDICTARLTVPGLSAVVGPDHIAAHGHSLSVPLYVRPGQEDAAPAISDLLRRRTEVRKQLAEVDREIDALLRAMACAQQQAAPGAGHA